MRERELRVMVRQAYHELRVLERKRAVLAEADSIHAAAVAGEQQRFDLGATNALQRATARSQAMLIRARLRDAEASLAQAQRQLQKLMNSHAPARTLPGDLKVLPSSLPDDDAIARHPLVKAQQELERSAEARWRSERSNLLPGFTVGVASMTLNQSPSVPDGSVIYDRSDRFTTVKAGIAVPLAFGAQSARNKAARIMHERALTEVAGVELELRTQLQQLRDGYAAQLDRVTALEQGAAQEAAQLRIASAEAFANGQIDRLEWTLLNGQAIDLMLEHLDALLALGRVSIELEAFNEQ